MKIGLFPGSFNPIHIGHLALMDYIIENTDMDVIWILPTPQNPLKDKKDILPYSFRLELINEIISQDDRYSVCTIERMLPKPNYTVRTISALKMCYPQHEFCLIIGADNWASFNQWYSYERLIFSCSLYVYPRLGNSIESEVGGKQNPIYLADAPLIGVSSTAIRRAILDGKCLKHWLPNPDRWEDVVIQLNKLNQLN